MSVPLEHDYIGLSSSSSDPCSSSSTMEKSANKNNVLGLKATELRLGLPGLCQDLEENICKNSPAVKNNVCGAKRGFSDVVFENKKTEELNSTIVEEKKKASVDSKAQVVGWPPIRSFRKNTMATTSPKNGDIAEGCFYVKVSMDGAPYLRKVDLKTCQNYTQLSKALEKMFNCFILGQCTSNGIRRKEGLSESNVKDLLHRDECVLTYEDKDGDWMLVGDVPWEMFIDSCKRLRIMKGSDAIGLAPRSMEKSKNQTRRM